MTTTLAGPARLSLAAVDRLRARTEALLARSIAGHIVFWATISLAFFLLTRNLVLGIAHTGILDWDEARHGVSAYEMLQRGNFLVNTYRGAPDYWNLKPPVSFWTIALSFKLFGYSAVALRLPSVIATLLTAALATGYAYRRFGRVAAVITALFLASSSALITEHSGRTGDPDALFILFMTASVLCSVEAMRRPGWLIGSTTFFSLAFLTKSFHAALALVFALVVTAIAPRGDRARLRHAALALLGLLPLLAWVLARFSYDGTQFLSQMVTYDLLSRGSTVIEGHTGPPESYVQALRAQAGPWLLVAAAALVAVVAGRTRAELTSTVRGLRGRGVVALGLWVIVVFAAFSAASSKLPWYTTSAIPALGIIVGALAGRALAQRGAVRAILLGGLAASLLLTQIDLRDSRNAEIGVPMQVLLFQLNRAPQFSGRDIYLDPGANYSDTNSAWSQSMTLAAELGGDLVPRDEGLAGVTAATTTRTLVFLQRGSAMEAGLAKAGRLEDVVSDGASRIAWWTRTSVRSSPGVDER